MSKLFDVDQENTVSSPKVNTKHISKNRNVDKPINTRKREKSTMLKSSTSAASSQLLPTAQTSTSTSNYLPDTQTVEDLQPTAPKKQKAVIEINENKKDKSRRSPVLATSASKTITEPRIASLNEENTFAREDHQMQIKILNEKLKQEKIKTKLLELQLHREEARMSIVEMMK